MLPSTVIRSRPVVSGVVELAGRPATAVAVAALGLLLRVAFLVAIRHQPLQSDAASYSQMAALLAQHQSFLPFWPPGVPLYLALVQQLFGDSALVTRFAMLPCYLALCLVLYAFTRELTGSRAAATASMLPLALAPEMIFFSLEPTTELPSAFFLTLSALCLLRLQRAFRFKPLLLLSLSLGILALMRPASLILLAAVPIYLLVNKQGLVRSFAPTVLPLVMVFAWIVHVHQATGQLVWVNTANAKNFYLGNNQNTPLYRTWWLGSHHTLEDAALPVHPSDPIQLEHEYLLVAEHYTLAHPALFVLRTFNRACVFFATDTFTGAYLIETYGFERPVGLAVIALDALLFAGIGVAAILFFAVAPQSRGLILALVLLYAAPYFIAFSHPRYHVAIEPLLFAAAAAFLLRFAVDRNATLATLSVHKTAALAAVSIFLLIQLEFLVIVGRAHV